MRQRAFLTGGNVEHRVNHKQDRCQQNADGYGNSILFNAGIVGRSQTAKRSLLSFRSCAWHNPIRRSETSVEMFQSNLFVVGATSRRELEALTHGGVFNTVLAEVDFGLLLTTTEPLYDSSDLNIPLRQSLNGVAERLCRRPLRSRWSHRPLRTATIPDAHHRSTDRQGFKKKSLGMKIIAGSEISGTPQRSCACGRVWSDSVQSLSSVRAYRVHE